MGNPNSEDVTNGAARVVAQISAEAEANVAARPARIDGNVSDLFFNLDLDAAKIYVDGKFAGFDRQKLIEEAEWFAGALSALGVDPGAPEDIVEDFLSRF